MQGVSTVSNLNYLQNSYSTKTSKASSVVESSDTSSAKVVDTYTPSGKAPDQTTYSSKDAAKVYAKDTVEGFNLDEFRTKIHQQLLDLINQGKKAIKDSGTDVQWANDILYAVDPDTKAAEVPEEYNADNTSQRIVDFALQFRDAAKASGMSDEDFMKQIKGAIDEGFRLAKHDIGSVPSSVAKLFNDTYQATMDKLDKAMASWTSSTSSTSTDQTVEPVTATA